MIPATSSLITAPTVPAMDLTWAKDHIRGIGDREDHLIEAWIAAATGYFEEQTGHQIMLATWEYWLDAFPYQTKIELPRPPLREVTALTYIASDGSELGVTDGGSPEVALWQTRAPAGVPARLGWVEISSGQVWPTPRVESGAVRIRYTAGYAETAAEVPDLIKAILALLVAHFEQFRSEVHLSDRSSKIEQLPLGVDQMMFGFKASAKPSQVLRTLL